jgi:hypothetical protein
MKLLAGFVAVLLIVSASAEIPSAEKTVSDLENQWAEAQKTGNADVVAPMLADTFTDTDADGETYGKSQLLSNLKGGKWGGQSHQRCESEGLRQCGGCDRIMDRKGRRRRRNPHRS